VGLDEEANRSCSPSEAATRLTRTWDVEFFVVVVEVSVSVRSVLFGSGR
jgi:hypothetical protein